MAAKKVKVVLDLETAVFTVDETGFQGEGCADVMRMFDTLGDTLKAIKKPEYKQKTVNLQRK